MIRDLAQTGIADRVITPGPSGIILPPGFTDARVTVAGVEVPASKVLDDTTIAGTTGTMINKTGAGVIITPSNADQAVSQGYTDGAFGSIKVAAVVVPAAKVLAGTTIAGTPGVYPTNPSGGSQSWTTPGTYSWPVPDGVTRVMATVIGAGGGGGSATVSYGGGGGGGACNAGWVPVTAGSAVTVVVGTGGIGGTGSNFGTAGGASSFGTLASSGGNGGGGSASSGSVPGGAGGVGNGVGYPNILSFDGGLGGSGQSYGGGGGGGAGTGAVGATGADISAGSGGAASLYSSTIPGGAGGNGGNYNQVGNSPGGGGGGQSYVAGGHNGGSGAVYIRY